jgi:hypothetical protein
VAKKRQQADHRADTRGKPLSGLPHVVVDSAAYLALTAFERAVLCEILRRFNGYNNGMIAITYEQLGDRLKGPNTCRPNNARIARAIAKLVDHGLLAEPTPASWLERRAREYRLTFISSGKCPPFRSATNEYLSWCALKGKTTGDVASPRTPSTGDTRSPTHGASGYNTSSGKSENRSFGRPTSPSAGDGGSLLIGKPYPTAPNGSGTSVIHVTGTGTG